MKFSSGSNKLDVSRQDGFAMQFLQSEINAVHATQPRVTKIVGIASVNSSGDVASVACEKNELAMPCPDPCPPWTKGHLHLLVDIFRSR
jgi:hypothetical protein